MKKTLLLPIFILALMAMELTSCGGTFWQGMANGMAGFYGGAGGRRAPARTSLNGTGSLDFLLDPNYAIQQVQQQYNSGWNNGVAFPQNYNTGFSTSVPTAVVGGVTAPVSQSSTSPPQTSSSHQNTSKSFCRFCANTRKCQQCGGDGRRTDTQFGTGKSLTEKCGICGGTGICPYCPK